MSGPWVVKPGVVRKLTRAEKACKNSDYFNLVSHRKTYIDGYKQGQIETIERVKEWLIRNKTGIMGVHDTYIDLYLQELDKMKDK